MKLIICFCLILIGFKQVISQNSFENRLFKAISNEVIQHNKKYIQTENLKHDFRLVESISGEILVDTIHENTLKKNEPLCQEELMILLQTPRYNFFSKSKKLYILDTICFFSKDFIYKNEQNEVVITNDISKIENKNFIYFNGISNKNNELIISFSLFEDNSYFLCYALLKDNDIKIVNSKLVTFFR